jgi:hypothetical protein
MVLWVCPKTFIAPVWSAIIQDIEHMHAAGLAMLAYYYFDFRDVKKQDCYGLLTSFLGFLPIRTLVTTSSPSYIVGKYSRHSKARYRLAQRMRDGRAESDGARSSRRMLQFSGRPSAREEILEIAGL